jgi:hypothetical protein
MHLRAEVRAPGQSGRPCRRQMSAFLRGILDAISWRVSAAYADALAAPPSRLWRPEAFTWITAEERSLRRLLQSCPTLPI